VDDAVRNALTKMSHLHFTPTQQSFRRVLAMGEEPWRVHRSGAPSLDHLRHARLPSREQLEQTLGRKLRGRPIVVAYHPVTLEKDTIIEADAVFAALDQLARMHKDRQIIFCFPNADAGSRALIQRAQNFCEQHVDAHLYVNLGHLHYWRLLQEASLLIGNSSSGIMETPSLALPTVNIGKRQQGREQARNSIDAPAQTQAIVTAAAHALDPAFKESLKNMDNPYGEGKAGERIARVLAEAPLGEKLLVKRALPLSPEDPPMFCPPTNGHDER
jgi:UDP-N-acetylglucosamine 2-epimerase (non-hydrolysing)/GDP/UDP-N,N'-diacetylbacillosamine 2-epimerase (hydrolysing)